MTKINFDLEQSIQALRDGADLNGKDGILTPLLKQLAETAMQGELEQCLSQDSQPNCKKRQQPQNHEKHRW